MKKLGCAMVLVPATIVAHRMLLNTWNGWCIVMLIIIITGASAQDMESPPGTDGLPPQVRKGMDMSHEAYCFGAFDCDEPRQAMRYGAGTQTRIHDPTTSGGLRVSGYTLYSTQVPFLLQLRVEVTC